MNEWPPSTRPFRNNPPRGTIGVVLPIRDGLPFFKMTFHSILAFSDARYMFAIVDNMSGLQTRQYLEGVRRNHPVNVLQYQKDHNLSAEWNVGLRFLFAFANVEYGFCLTPTVVVPPLWLSQSILTIDAHEKPIQPQSNASFACAIGMKRALYEKLGGFDETKNPVLDWAFRGMAPISGGVYFHKFILNTFDARGDELWPQSQFDRVAS